MHNVKICPIQHIHEHPFLNITNNSKCPSNLFSLSLNLQAFYKLSSPLTIFRNFNHLVHLTSAMISPQGLPTFSNSLGANFGILIKRPTFTSKSLVSKKRSALSPVTQTRDCFSLNCVLHECLIFLCNLFFY